jgi:glycosyltransferase involved in cell wall biosynthesis
MRIALVNLTSGGLSGGYRKYLDRLTPRLRLQPGVDRLDVFMPPALAGRDELSWPRRDSLTGYRGLRKEIARLHPDVVFIPTARWFDTGGVPTVVMVRNMEPLEVPFGGNSWREGAKNLVRAYTARRACARADRVIAVSEHVSDFLRSHWHLDAGRLGVVYHGIDPPDTIEPPRPASLSVLGRNPFLFTAGSIRPARGLEDLVGALAVAQTLPSVRSRPLSAAGVGAEGVDKGLQLVVAGQVDRGAEGYDRRLQDLAERGGVAHRIIWPGHLTAAEMSWCFRNAELFVMTSRAEACPNIALEAMSHGAVTVSGENAPMPEFFRDAARYYRPGDPSSLAVAIRETLALPRDEKEALRSKARSRAGDFDWDATAERTIAELRKVVA